MYFILLSDTVLPVLARPGVFGPGTLNTESSRLVDILLVFILSALPGTLGLARTIEELEFSLVMLSLELVLGTISDFCWRLLLP